MVVARTAAKEENGIGGNPQSVTRGETAMAAPEQKDKPKGVEFYGGHEVYCESGVDLTLLRENLRLSLEERWEKNQRALEFARTLQQTGRSLKEIAPPPDRPLDTRKAITLVNLLASHRVQYVIVGEQAMHAYGSTLMTEAIDICYRRTSANLEALVAAIAPLHPSLRGAPPELSFHFDVPTLATGRNFLLMTDCGYINLVSEVNGVGAYEQVLAQSIETTVYGLPIRILSIDALIAAKKAADRDNDQLHLLELIELKTMLDAAKPVEETP
jgi:hypothetical protein